MKVSYKKIPEIVRLNMNKIMCFEDGWTYDPEVKKGVAPKYWLLDSENGFIWGVASLKDIEWIASTDRPIHEYLVFNNKGKIFEISIKSVKFNLHDATSAY